MVTGETSPLAGILFITQFRDELATSKIEQNQNKVNSKPQVVATETSLPAATLGHLALAEKQYLGLTFLQVLLMLVDMYNVHCTW